MLKENRSLSKTSVMRDVDSDNLPQRVVRFAPRKFNGDVMFGLPPLENTSYVVIPKMLTKMEWRYDGLVWTVKKVSNIKNDHNLIFVYVTCVAHLVVGNSSCPKICQI